ncbi:MAG: dTDP-4-dehydrorhamnose reductase [Myxococcota bacterium]
MAAHGLAQGPIWITGGRGMLATALAACLQRAGVGFVATDSELDVSDAGRVLAFARSERPSLIVNAAAYTRVDDAETHRDEAFRVNASGVQYLAEAARALGVRLLHYSTDYVFDGAGSSPYREDHPMAAVSVYGASKQRGEELANKVLPDSCVIVRTSWLFGENGANFVKTMVRLMQTQDEVRVVSDQQGRPTYTHDLAEVSLALCGAFGDPPAPAGTYHFANSGPTTWHGFAQGIRDVCLELGMKLAVQRIVPVTTAEFPRPAPRPAYSVLDTHKIEAYLGGEARSWRDALRAYLLNENS